MEADRAMEIIQSLADGLDPYTGDRCPSDSPYQQTDQNPACVLAARRHVPDPGRLGGLVQW